MAGLTFKVNTLGIKNLPQELAKSATQTEHAVAVQAQKDTELYVPARTLSLSDKTQVVGNTIVYPGPYARYLYYGKVMVYKDPPIMRPRKKDGKMVRSHYGQTKHPIDIPLDIKQSVHEKAQSHWFEASKAANLNKWLEVAAKAVTRFGK